MNSDSIDIELTGRRRRSHDLDDNRVFVERPIMNGKGVQIGVEVTSVEPVDPNLKTLIELDFNAGEQ